MYPNPVNQTTHQYFIAGMCQPNCFDSQLLKWADLFTSGMVRQYCLEYIQSGACIFVFLFIVQVQISDSVVYRHLYRQFRPMGTQSSALKSYEASVVQHRLTVGIIVDDWTNVIVKWDKLIFLSCVKKLSKLINSKTMLIFFIQVLMIAFCSSWGTIQKGFNTFGLYFSLFLSYLSTNI